LVLLNMTIAVTLSAAGQAAPAELDVGFLTPETATAAAGVRGEGAVQAVEALGARVLGEAGAAHVLGGAPLQALVGLGERKPEREADLPMTEVLRRAAAQALNLATDLRRASLCLRAPEVAGLASEHVVEALAEGVLLSAHARTRRPTVSPKDDAARPPERCTIVLRNVADGDRAALARACALVEAVRLARELGDIPANRLAPLQLAEQAADAGRDAGLTAEVLDVAALERLGAGLLLAVGAGSTRGPALAALRYRPEGARRHVAVVGKGITFDAGGISIKPAKSMGDMVHDKAGAAAAAGIAVGAARLELPVAVTAVLACAENLPSGAAYRPGDVLTGLDGSTVEIIDTDAEGRLVLADALTYALRERLPVDAIVDLATLTGSIVSALGNEAAGLFGNTNDLASRMLEASAAAGEPLWRMPILTGHRAQLKSERADRKQCADRWGDCAIAAAFLEAYVDKRPWLHLDIAGVAYNEGSPEWPAYHPRSGAAGAGVRTVLRFLTDYALG
jgi:leucyl aminopeptidase